MQPQTIDSRVERLEMRVTALEKLPADHESDDCERNLSSLECQPEQSANSRVPTDFKTLDDNFGDDPIGQSLERIDPILQHYDEGLSRLGDQAFFRKSLEDLFIEHPFGESRPPFALGQKQP